VFGGLPPTATTTARPRRPILQTPATNLTRKRPGGNGHQSRRPRRLILQPRKTPKRHRQITRKPRPKTLGKNGRTRPPILAGYADQFSSHGKHRGRHRPIARKPGRKHPEKRPDTATNLTRKRPPIPTGHGHQFSSHGNGRKHPEKPTNSPVTVVSTPTARHGYGHGPATNPLGHGDQLSSHDDQFGRCARLVLPRVS